MKSPRKSIASACLVATLLLTGCANDGSEYGEEIGGTWGAGPWELPTQVRKSFAQKHPGADIAAWDRHSFEGGESVYDIIYHGPTGESHSVRLSAMGKVLPVPKPQTQSELAQQPVPAPQSSDQQADVNQQLR